MRFVWTAILLLATPAAAADDCVLLRASGTDWTVDPGLLRSMSLGVLVQPSAGWCVVAPGRPPAHTTMLLSETGPQRPEGSVLLERLDGSIAIVPRGDAPAWSATEKELTPWTVDTVSGPLAFRVLSEQPIPGGDGTQFWRAAAPGRSAGYQGSVWAVGREPEASPPAAIAGALSGVRRMPEPERREWLDRQRNRPPEDAGGDGWSLSAGVLTVPACGVAWTLAKGERWAAEGGECGVVRAVDRGIRMEVRAVPGDASAEQIATEAVGLYASADTKTELRRCMLGDALGWEAWIHTDEIAERRLCTVRKGGRTWTVKADYSAEDATVKGLVVDGAWAGLMLSE